MPVKIPEVISQQLENAIVSLMKQNKIPGVSLACMVDGDIIYARGFGARNLEQNLPMTPDTLYGIASCTKSFTALAIMQLVQQGKLNLHDPVKNYVDFRLGDKKNPITIHSLLCHSSGLPGLDVAEIISGRLTNLQEKFFSMSDFNDFYTHINGANTELIFKPGEHYFYSNEGYILLGEIIEKVTKMKLEDYITENILKPLKMNRSTYLKKNYEKDSNRITGYSPKGAPVPERFSRLLNASGGIRSTVIEQLNYLQLYIDNGIFEGVRIIDSELLKEMEKPHNDKSDFVRSHLGPFWKEAYGYGWRILNDFFGHEIIFHLGRTRVETAGIAYIRDKKIGIVMGCNSGSGDKQLIPLIAFTILAFLLGKNPIRDIPIFSIEKKLNKLKGNYESYKGFGKISIIKRDSLLYIEEEGDNGETDSVPLIPETDTIDNYNFYIKSGPAGRMSVKFMIDGEKINMIRERRIYHKK